MKKYTKYLILSFIMVLCIMAITVGLSYSLFNYSKKGNIKNKIVTGLYSSCEYENGTEWTFDYTGSSQDFTVPCDGEYKIELWGAQGGSKGSNLGGAGAYVSGEILLEKSQNFYIYVGEKGIDGTIDTNMNPSVSYNGGGSGANTTYTLPMNDSPYVSASGGGATDIRLVNGNWNNFAGLKSRIMVAGAGGGAAYYGTSGIGGKLVGISSSSSSGSRGGALGASGGTQTSGGKTPSSTSSGTSLEVTGNDGFFGHGGAATIYIHPGGGGGSGYYGGGSGGSGGNSVGGSAGGGGSSFISGYNGCDSIAKNSTSTNIIHTNQANHYSGYVFYNSLMIAGNEAMPTHDGTGTMTGNTGNGYAKITLVKSKERYREKILNGTDPVLKNNLIPIKIASDGSVTKASIYDKWYSYQNKEWANAVVLKDESVTYKNGEEIPESNIESYFVWIPRYKYKIFDEGNYTGLTQIESKEQVIEVVFESKDVTPSNGTTKGSYLTHPAFTSFDSNGMWVGKFETGYDGATTTEEAQVNSVVTDKIIIKPNVYSWRNITVGNMFKNSYEYQRELDSHMMKNTEWGAVAYLQHSQYGSATSVRVNNNSSYITGYAGVEEPTLGYNGGISIEGNRVESTSLGVDGTYTINYLNSNSQVASTTGNYTGVYDMSGGSWEYVMGYTTGASTVGGSSGITSLYPNFFSDSTYTKYWDKYTSTVNTNYNNRILGDATGEMGPFSSEKDPAGYTKYKSSWYADYAFFAPNSHPWFSSGGSWDHGIYDGIFSFSYANGSSYTYIGYRIVLTIA